MTGVLLAATGLALQAAEWNVTGYANTESAQKGLEQLIEQGEMPVGFDIDPEGTNFVLSVSSDLRAGGVEIVRYEVEDALGGYIQYTIEQGWMPFGLARTGQVMSILWVEIPLEVEEWRLAESALDINARAATINQFAEEGYSLWDVSAESDRMTYLFLKFPEPAYNQVSITPFFRRSETLADEINTITNQGWLPNGLAVNEQFLFFVVMQ